MLEATSVAVLLLALVPPAPQEETVGPAARASEPEPLNVVLIVADDLGIGDLGCYGGSIPTPNIDALAKDGARFMQAYATAPTCGPSRAGLLSGRHQQRFGFEFNTRWANIAANREHGLPAQVPILPERLREAGLGTGMVGKWHLGMRPDAHPLARGFQDFFGFLGGLHAYLPDGKAIGGTPLLRGDAEVEEREYLTDAFARQASAFIAGHAGEPFFLYLAFNAPHRPHEASEPYLARFPDLEGTTRVYAAMVSALDDAIGRVRAAVVEAGIAERTLIVFLSDNGAVAGEGEGSNGPLRLGKFYLFEGGVRVPLIVLDPRSGRRGLVVDQPVSTLDLYPTICAAAGAAQVSSSELDGVDLGPLFRQDAASVPARSLGWRSGTAAALRSGDLKLIRCGASVWLFDLARDPGETQDLSADRPEAVEALRAELEAWERGLVPPLWEGSTLESGVEVAGKPYRAEY